MKWRSCVLYRIDSLHGFVECAFLRVIGQLSSCGDRGQLTYFGDVWHNDTLERTPRRQLTGILRGDLGRKSARLVRRAYGGADSVTCLEELVDDPAADEAIGSCDEYFRGWVKGRHGGLGS